MSDRADGTGQLQAMREFVGDVAGVGVDRDRAEARAREPAEEERGRVLQQQHHRVTRDDAALDEPGGNAVDLVAELPVGPCRRLTVAVFPHQERVGAIVFDPLRQRAGDVHPGERVHRGQRDRGLDAHDSSEITRASARRRA